MSQNEWWIVAFGLLTIVMIIHAIAIFLHSLKCDKERTRLHNLLSEQLTNISQQMGRFIADIESEKDTRRDVNKEHLARMDKIIQSLSIWHRLQEQPPFSPDEGHKRNI